MNFTDIFSYINNTDAISFIKLIYSIRQYIYSDIKFNKYCYQYYRKQLKKSCIYWLEKKTNSNIVKQIYFTEENILKYHIKKSNFIVDFEYISEKEKCLLVCCMVFVQNNKIQYYILLDITNNRNFVYCNNKKIIQTKPSIKFCTFEKQYSKKYYYHIYRICTFYKNFYKVDFINQNYIHWLDKM